MATAESYLALMDRLERAEFVQAVRQGLEDEQNGRLLDARQSLAALREKLAVSG